MKNKTAIDIIEEMIAAAEYQYGHQRDKLLIDIKNKLPELKELSKTQIVDAHEAGFLSNDLPIEYYNKTYKQ